MFVIVVYRVDYAYMKRIFAIIMCLAPLPATHLQAQQPFSDIRQAVVTTALSLEGSPYRYGGTGEKGFDCSGFVRTVFLRNNIVLPHSSRAQYNDCTPITLDEACAGDLIFFDVRGRGISHVGIYLGERRFIHAATSIGRVCISSLDEPYWKIRFYAVARRISVQNSGNTESNAPSRELSMPGDVKKPVTEEKTGSNVENSLNR